MISRLLVVFVRLLVGAYPRWLGSAPAQTQRIYFANHASHLDALVLWSALPPALRRHTRPVAARDYWGTGFRRWLALRGFNAVLIERRRETCEGDPLQPLYDALAAGDSLIIFPEGTRHHDVLPQPFKSGLFHLATRFPDVEPVAVYLDTTRRSLPKGSLLPVPLICTVRFGAAVTPMPGEDKNAYLERARNTVATLA